MSNVRPPSHMLTLAREKAASDGTVIRVFESAAIRLTISSRTPTDITGFILSYDFQGADRYSLEWSDVRGFAHAKVHQRSRDIFESSPADRPFDPSRISLAVGPEYSLLLQTVGAKISQYDRSVA